jgi:hypothetical protein
MTHHVYTLSGLPDAVYVGITCLETSEKQRLLKSNPPKWLRHEFSPDVIKNCKLVAVTGKKVSKTKALALEAATVAEQLGSGAYCRGGFLTVLAALSSLRPGCLKESGAYMGKPLKETKI